MEFSITHGSLLFLLLSLLPFRAFKEMTQTFTHTPFPFPPQPLTIIFCLPTFTETTCVQLTYAYLIAKVNGCLMSLSHLPFRNIWCHSFLSLITWFIWFNSISLTICSLPLSSA